MASPLLSTWALWLAAVVCLVIALVAGRDAQRHRFAAAGRLAVIALFTATLLAALALYRVKG
jgi:ABC-type transport system involved in cytochrome c biogenesis permease component